MVQLNSGLPAFQQYHYPSRQPPTWMDQTRNPVVIPGWSEGPDPESRDSGFVLRTPRNDVSILSEDARIITASSDDLVSGPRIARRVAICSIGRLRRAPCRTPRRRRPPGSSRSLHDFSRSVRGHGPAIREPKPAGADGLYRGHLCQRAAAVLGAAVVHQNGAAAARRLAGGMVGGDGVFPVAAAWRLCLRALSVWCCW